MNLELLLKYNVSLKRFPHTFFPNESLELRMTLQPSIIKHWIIFGVDIINDTLRYSNIIDNQISVQVLQCYPEDKEGKYFDSLEMWCYPDGIKIYDQNMKILNDKDPEFSFTTSALDQLAEKSIPVDDIGQLDLLYSFVFTDIDLKRRYCTCLTFHEKCFIEDDVKLKTQQHYSKAFPKCSVKKIALNPLKLDNDSILVYIPKCLVVVSEQPYIQLQRSYLGYIYKTIILKKNMNAKLQRISINMEQYQQFNLLAMNCGLPKAEIKFDKEYRQHKRQLKKPKPYKDLLRIRETQLFEFFVSVSQLLQSCPKLKAYQIFNQKEQMILHYATQQDCFHPSDVNLLNIFRRYSLETILKLIKNVILERQIIAFSKRPQLLIELFQSIFYLISPYKWENIYIPFLPLHLWRSIDAPGSFIIGMSKIHLNYLIQNANQSLAGKVIVDLDEQIIIQEGEKNIIQFPKSISGWIHDELSKLQLSKKELKSQKHQTRQKKWLKLVNKIKQFFFNFMLMLLNNYRPFIKQTTPLQNKPKTFQFDQEQYLKLFNEEEQKFYRQLSQTMMFSRLCQMTLQAKKILEWNQTDELALFIYCQSIIQQKVIPEQPIRWDFINMHKELFAQILSYEDYVLGRSDRNLEKKEVILLEQYLIKYIKYLEFKGIQSISAKHQEQKESSFFEDLQRQNDLYFVNLTEKKKNWSYLNKKNSITFQASKMVNPRAMFQSIRISRFMDDLDDSFSQKDSDHRGLYYSSKG